MQPIPVQWYSGHLSSLESIIILMFSLVNSKTQPTQAYRLYAHTPTDCHALQTGSSKRNLHRIYAVSSGYWWKLTCRFSGQEVLHHTAQRTWTLNPDRRLTERILLWAAVHLWARIAWLVCCRAESPQLHREPRQHLITTQYKRSSSSSSSSSSSLFAHKTPLKHARWDAREQDAQCTNRGPQ